MFFSCEKGGGIINFVGYEGYLVADPKPFFDEKGKVKSCYYTVANNDRECGTPDYVSCIAYGKNAEIANSYFKGGTHVIAEGYLTTRPDKKGIYRMVVVIRKNQYLKNEKLKDADPFQKGKRQQTMNTSMALTEPDFERTYEEEFEIENYEEDYM